jgi:flagellar L-ring protein precursor FlgH
MQPTPDHLPTTALIVAALPWLTLAVAVILLAGCATAPAQPEAGAAAAMSAVPVAQSGSIFSDAQSGGLFEDRKARNVGDTLTVLLAETTAAKTSASTNTGKTTNAEIGAPTVFGMPVSINGVAVLSGALDSKHSFAGSGDSSQSNTLQGSVTVTVIRVQPNGNLVVRGDKRLEINQGDEVVRIEGVVRPADIAPDNTVPSSRVADARIAYTGSGALSESNSKGWLARFFASPLWPF